MGVHWSGWWVLVTQPNLSCVEIKPTQPNPTHMDRVESVGLASMFHAWYKMGFHQSFFFFQ